MGILALDHWLFVCSANYARSPTAEYVARKMWYLAASCGTQTETDSWVVVPLSWHLIEWATVIVCMEQHHVDAVKAHSNAQNKPIYCWDQPDHWGVPYHEELLKICEMRFLETLQKHENRCEEKTGRHST